MVSSPLFLNKTEYSLEGTSTKSIIALLYKNGKNNFENITESFPYAGKTFHGMEFVIYFPVMKIVIMKQEKEISNNESSRPVL